MSTLPSKHQKSQSFNQLMLVLALVVAIAFLVTFGANARNFDNAISRALGNQVNTYSGNSADAAPSFAMDEQYWSMNCSHGWTGDSACDGIVSRAQSCEFASASGSTYCADYEKYLLQFQSH